MPPGQYWHNGIAKNLITIFEDSPEQEIKLSFNVDGLPLAHSSGSQLWPILCSVKGSNIVFAAGIYHGYAKPESEALYLQDVVAEITSLIENGLQIGGKHFKVSLCCCSCDAPAKAFVLCLLGCNGKHGCCKRTVTGKVFSHRVSYVQVEGLQLRTDKSFRLQLQPEHHLGVSSLLSIPGFKPVSHTVLDPMHLCFFWEP